MKFSLVGCAFFLCTALCLLGIDSVRSQEKEIKGENVKAVIYAKGGKKGASGVFTQAGKKHWVEDNADGRHHFMEDRRDEWSVYLTRDDLEIQIDLFRKQIFMKNKDEQQRPLYTILKSF